MKTSFVTQRTYTRSGGMKTTFGDFTCLHCRRHVSAALALSGVHNRNHCPYCLSSRHLDLFGPGDRLSACKMRMKPVALTLKRAEKRYQFAQPGELMLVHQCEDCGKISINRIAADDDNGALLDIYHASQSLDAATRTRLLEASISPLGAAERKLVNLRLFGQK
jgi:hypothetical protein